MNILLNNILVQRGLVSHEQRWEDRKMVRAAGDEITIGTEHWRSDEWKDRGRVAGPNSNRTLCGSDETMEASGEKWWLM